MKRLYVTTLFDHEVCQTKDNVEYEIKCERLNRHNAGLKLSLMWNIACLGRVWHYYITDASGKRIHSSFVVRGKSKFTFVGERDIEIGPCETDPDYRGHNIYPYVLSHIIEEELDEKGKAYMVVDDDNPASIRGILKAGFRPTGDIITVNRLKQYRITGKDTGIEK